MWRDQDPAAPQGVVSSMRNVIEDFVRHLSAPGQEKVVAKVLEHEETRESLQELKRSLVLVSCKFQLYNIQNLSLGEQNEGSSPFQMGEYEGNECNAFLHHQFSPSTPMIFTSWSFTSFPPYRPAQPIWLSR